VKYSSVFCVERGKPMKYISVFLDTPLTACVRETERQRDRQRQRERDRERHTHREREREGDRQVCA
jgi:hypothetical protein